MSFTPVDHFRFLFSDVYKDFALHPGHLADLRKSSLTDETIAQQNIRTVPPHMIDQLLGFEMPKVMHAYVIPFADPHGGWTDHVRMKVFPSITTERGTIKYLQPRQSGVRIYVPLATREAVRYSGEPLYIVEGEKKALSVAQLGLPAVGICGIEGWHVAGATTLHPDLDDVGLVGRTVLVIPDRDWKTNPHVNRAVYRLGDALRARGAAPRLVLVPDGYKGIDDYIVANP